MRPLRTRHLHHFLRSVDLADKSIRKPQRPKQKGPGVPVFANPEANDHLDSWKEIASHLKRTVRTVQRWEKQERLPVHRHLHQRANSVYARKSELDEWWNNEPHSLEIEPPQVASQGSRRQVTSPQVFAVIHSEEESRESDPTLPEWVIECVPELREAEIVAVLRLPCTYFRLVLYIPAWRKSSRLLPAI